MTQRHPEDTNRASQAGRDEALPNYSRPDERRDEERGDRPDCPAGDERTWQPDISVVCPPVVDAARNSER